MTMKKYITAYASLENQVVTVKLVSEPTKCGTVTKIGPSIFEAVRTFSGEQRLFTTDPNLFVVDENIAFVAAAKWCVGGCDSIVQAPNSKENIFDKPTVEMF